MDHTIYLTRFVVINYLAWFALGSTRANTIAYATSFRPRENFKYELRETMIRAIANGAKQALGQCMSQFRWERWNCPKSSFSRKFEGPATREMAFVNSISAAGIVYSVTRGCSSGDIPICGCRKSTFNPPSIEGTSPVDNDWNWGGCSDDVTIGDLVAEVFLTSLEDGSADVQARTNSHNSQLGRLVVREHVRPECKCHGLSGSCTTRTCWKRIAPISQVGDTLKQRYIRAQRIQVNTANRKPPLDIPEGQMVFLDESPDYCKVNITTGWAGTGGRICSRGRAGNDDKSEKRSCREVCRNCGHQVKKKPIKITWNCNCTFHWCCEVECKTCQKTIVQHFCDDTPQRY